MSQRTVKGSICFELRKYGGGRWTLDSVYDDKELATTEAKSLMERFKAILAVRVVAVAEENGQFREWTVFKQGITDDQQAVLRTPPPRPAPAPAPPVAKARETPAADRPKRRRMSTRLYYARLAGGMIIVVVVAVLGIAVLRMVP
ncbi:MAG TPA: hypothetical protein VEI03_03370 [Stellaceae bacterium]|nr:hypothetical protein [Stellaceae bacterium]